MTTSDEVAELVVDTDYDDISGKAIEKAKVSLRDILGVALYGSEHEIGNKITNYVTTTYGEGSSTILNRCQVTPPGAALANGTFGHAVDYDDAFESTSIHPSSPISPAAFALAEANNRSGKDLLKSYIVGVEAAFQLAHITYPADYQKGWHNTGTIGTLGATAAASSILDLNHTQVKMAIGMATSSSSSLRKNFGSMTKPLHSGHAAQMGVRSAQLASEGFTADDDIFQGDIGYSAMISDDDYSMETIYKPDSDWAVLDIGFKIYPSGYLTHAPMEALRELVIENDIKLTNISKIHVELDKRTKGVLLNHLPKDSTQARFSMEFCLAAVVAEVDVGLKEFSEYYVNSDDIREAMTKVERIYKDDLFDDSDDRRAARVIIETENGNIFANNEKITPGTPSNPASNARLEKKFFECASEVVGDDKARSLKSDIEELDEIEDISIIMT